MATSKILKSLQEYPEFETAVGIQGVIAYVHSVRLGLPPVYPPGLNARQRNRFDEKFGENFVDVGNRLYYRPNVPGHPGGFRLNLEVAFPAQRQAILNEIYNNDESGLGIGLNLFYYQVCSKFLGIKRAETSAFLKKQGDYQISRNNLKVINKPVLAKASNERWEIDSIYLLKYGADLNDPNLHAINPNNHNVLDHNNNYALRNVPGQHSYRFCMVVVDCFSKKVWAEPMLNLTSLEAQFALMRIILRAQTIPRVIQTDNGTEYRGAFHNYIMHTLNTPVHPCTQVYTTSHTPTTNGLVERMNQEVRKRIKKGFVRHNNLEWVNHLQSYCDNINNQRHTRNSYTPNEIWSQGYNEPPAGLVDFHVNANDHSSRDDLRRDHQARILRIANNMLQRGRTNVFQIGDLVRINLSAVAGQMGADMRERNKSRLEHKYTAIKYSPQVYRVQNIVAGNPPMAHVPHALELLGMNVWDLKRQSYWLVDVATNLAMHRHFYGNELVKVPPDSIAPNVNNPQRVNQINRFTQY